MITEDEKQIKRLLWEYGTADERIKDINLQIRLQKETQESMRDIGAVKIDGMPHTNGLSDPVCGAAIKIVDRVEMNIKDLVSELTKIYEMREMMRKLLSSLDDEEYRVISLRYIRHIRWSGLPSRIHCSRSTVFRIHDRAIRKLMENFKKTQSWD